MSPVFRKLTCSTLALLFTLCAGLVLAHDAFIANPEHQTDAPAVDFDRTDYLAESFEAWPPAGWTIINNSSTYTWEQNGSEAHSGEYSAFVAYGPQGVMQDEWLISPAIDLSGTAAPKLEWFEAEAYWPDYGYHHYIRVTTGDPMDMGGYSTLLDMTPAGHSIFGMDADPVTVDLSAYAGEPTVHVAFVYMGDWADNWYIDDARVYEPFDHDVAAVSVLPDGDQFTGGDSIIPEAVVANIGLNTETFDVEMVIAESGVEIYSQTITVIDLAPGSEGALEFPPLTLADGEFYSIEFNTQLVGDMDTSNDTAYGNCNTYTETHVPMGFLFTNSGCAPCVNINQALDDYIPTIGNDVALMRIHAWWPNSGDIMYQANVDQCTELIGEYGVSGVPDFWIDGVWSLGYDGAAAVPAFEEARLWKSPMNISLIWQTATDELMVTLDIVNALDPMGDFALFCSITEDGIEHNGGNGEPIHNQAFRRMYPDTDQGTAIDTGIGVANYNVACPLEDWDYANLRASVYVIDRNTRKMWQAATNFLTEIDAITPVALSFFELEQQAAAVALNWEVTGLSGVTDFRLVRSHAGGEVELSFNQSSPGVFEALDGGDVLKQGGEFRYSLFADEGDGWMILATRSIDVQPSAATTNIAGAFPNPFNPTTTIKYSVAKDGALNLSVFDLNGRLVKVLVSGQTMAGEHEIQWNGRDASGAELASGVYFVRLRTDTHSETSKIVLSK